VLLQGSLDPLLFSDGGSLSLTLWLGRSEPSLDSDRLSLGRSELSSPLSLGRFEPEVDGSLSDGGWLSLAEDARLGSPLWLGRSLPAVDVESLVDRDTDVLRESDSLLELDVEWLWESDCERLTDPDWDPMLYSDSLVDDGREKLGSLVESDCESLPDLDVDILLDWLSD